jgi:hypothetical protein
MAKSTKKAILKALNESERVTENRAEFGRANEAVRMLRQVFREIIEATADESVTRRLLQVMMRIILTDETSSRGERKVSRGIIKILERFELNANSRLSEIFFAPYAVSFNSASGLLTIDIAAFRPHVLIASPENANGFIITAAAAAVNFEEEQFEYEAKRTELLPLGILPINATRLEVQLPAGTSDTIIIILEIRFFIQDPVGLLMVGKEFNAAAIVLAR